MPGPPNQYKTPQVINAREAAFAKSNKSRYDMVQPRKTDNGGDGAPAPVTTQQTPGSGYSAPQPIAQQSMRDVDWFNSDAMYRSDRNNMATNFQDTLAQILFDRQNQYRGIDNSRENLGQARDRDTLSQGEDFASRGLASSGLYKQGLDRLTGQYESASADINSQEQNVTQQSGARGSLDAHMDESNRIQEAALYDGDFNALASIYGLLGQRGTAAGSRYGSDLNQARGQSAGRSTRNIRNTLGWG